jgi:hypothetical protein
MEASKSGAVNQLKIGRKEQKQDFKNYSVLLSSCHNVSFEDWFSFQEQYRHILVNLFVNTKEEKFRQVHGSVMKAMDQAKKSSTHLGEIQKKKHDHGRFGQSGFTITTS